MAYKYVSLISHHGWLYALTADGTLFRIEIDNEENHTSSSVLKLPDSQ